MSVNITVNGKYIKTCARHGLLDDPERVKKEIENERRKLRIQQVRAASKNITKKVLTDVELEKEKQLKKIEEIKAQEMEMWRQNILAQKNKDFRSSIFQIGTAHSAAQAENTKLALKKDQPKVRRTKFAQTRENLDKENVLKNANCQTVITGKCFPKPAARPSKPATTTTIEDASELDDSSIESSSDSSQSSSLSLSGFEGVAKKGEQKSKSKGQHLKNSVPVEIHVDSEESDTSLLEMPIRHDRTKTNPDERRGVALKTTTKQQSFKAKDKREESRPPPTEELLTAPSTSATAKKRFTQISDIIRQRKSSDDLEQPAVSRPQPTEAPKFQKSPSKSKSPSASSRIHKPAKSPAASREASATQASKASSSSRSSNTRVQFYDYNNKFHKQYDQPAAVETHEPPNPMSIQPNATQQAALEDRLLEARQIEMEKLRQKSTERCEKAMEREQIRRACEELTTKLDALTKQRQVLPSNNYQVASHRLNQVAKEKETKLHNAMEEILRRPAVITCPVVDAQKQDILTPTARQQLAEIYGLNLGSAFTQTGDNSLNSSDSCCSILLGYCDVQSKQINDDIQKYSKQNGQTDKAKAARLQNLLQRINRLRESLMEELAKCSASEATDKVRAQTMMDSINEFRKERDNIVTDDKGKDSLEKRESELKKNEALLEKKLRIFYKTLKASKEKEKLKDADDDQNHNEQKESEDRLTAKKSPKEKGEEVLPRDGTGTNFSPEERQSKRIKRPAGKEQVIEEAEESNYSSSEDEFIEQRKLNVSPKKPVEIVITVKGDAKNKKSNQKHSRTPRKLSTLVQSPTPKKVRRKLPTARSIDSNSTSYRSLPPKLHNNVDKILKGASKTPKKQHAVSSKNQAERPSEEDEQSPKRFTKKKSSNLNPLMAHYVQRLLGMSRTSINALAVTSSEIETPSSSILNTTANLSADELEKLASSRLENVQKLIEDSYSFVSELEESLSQSKSNDSSLKSAEVAWKKALDDNKTRKKDAGFKKPLKPTLKSPSRKQTHNPRPHPIALVDKSTQMTDNCTQRIAELTEMINKVRQEKQKILETTLSSGSENGRNSTEYLNLPDRRNNTDESTSRILDSQLVKSAENLPTQSPETTAAPRLEKDKLTGLSRDSGISLSRPITVQGSRESPVPDDMPQSQSTAESLSAQFKKPPKPPISIARYSPQLPEDIPHELSTIFEVDTPATSRLNASTHTTNGQHNQAAQVVKPKPLQTEQFAYRKFPTFEEYNKMNQLDMTQFDPEFSVQFEKEFNEFINIVKEGKDTDYEEFASISKYLGKSTSSRDKKQAAEELFMSLKMANLSYKRFPTRKEYLEKLGVSNADLLDSQSLDNVHSNSCSSSSSSLMNIENELKLRDILTRSFQQSSAPNDNNKGSSSNGISSNISQNKQQQGDISGIRPFTTGGSSTDKESINLEEDLKNMGIKWPSVMKRKTLETQALSSSTTSNEEAFMFTPRRKPVTGGGGGVTQPGHETTTQTEDGGQQLNLREFLKNELLKRTTSSTSFSFSEDSVASSILRSILGSMTPSSGGGQKQDNGLGEGYPTLDRHKTSTPMASQSTSSAKLDSKSKSKGGTSSMHLFSGESRLSSVHFNNSSKIVNKTEDTIVNKA